jgi:hypothetical protein
MSNTSPIAKGAAKDAINRSAVSLNVELLVVTFGLRLSVSPATEPVKLSRLSPFVPLIPTEPEMLVCNKRLPGGAVGAVKPLSETVTVAVWVVLSVFVALICD